MCLLWSSFVLLFWSSGDYFPFFKHRAKAVATQATSMSLNIFTRSDPRAKRNTAQQYRVVYGEAYCTILIQGTNYSVNQQMHKHKLLYSFY